MGATILLNLLVVGLALCAAAATEYGATTNPTGNPIGGGPGYNKIISKTDRQVTKVVSTASQLTSALSVAKSGDVVYVEDSATITVGCTRMEVRSGVTLASGRGRDGSKGGLIRSTCTTYSFIALLATGSGVSVTGLRFQGPDPEIGDHGQGQSGANREAGVQGSIVYGVVSNSPKLEVSNCELWGWSGGAVALNPGATECYVGHSFIHHNRRTGMGYHASMGRGTSSARQISMLVEACVLGAARHVVASAGDAYTSFEARYNVVTQDQHNHYFDRHGTVSPGNWVGGLGGDYTKVFYNTVRGCGDFAVSMRGIPTKPKGLQVRNNWFRHASQSKAVELYDASRKDRYDIRDNLYGSTRPTTDDSEPRVVHKQSVRSGKSPLTVSYSSDMTGFTRIEWNFGDQTYGEGVNVTHTFKEPGLYLVGCTGWAKSGIPYTVWKQVMVYPEDGGYWISAWVKDSYRGKRAGFYAKQVLVDGKVVWSEDVVGDQGWEHVVVDVTKQVRGKSKVELSVRAIATKAMTSAGSQIMELFSYWDDVYLFGSEGMLDGAFEDPASTSWAYKGTTSSWYGKFTQEEVNSGETSFRLLHYFARKSVAGSTATLTRTVKVGSADYGKMTGDASSTPLVAGSVASLMALVTLVATC